jgi:hypothetical protein
MHKVRDKTAYFKLLSYKVTDSLIRFFVQVVLHESSCFTEDVIGAFRDFGNHHKGRFANLRQGLGYNIVIQPHLNAEGCANRSPLLAA